MKTTIEAREGWTWINVTVDTQVGEPVSDELNTVVCHVLDDVESALHDHDAMPNGFQQWRVESTYTTKQVRRDVE